MASAIQAHGWIGVDLFFVLSAFLLVALLDREHAATGTTRIGKFFARRALRIWPLFFVYVAACFLLTPADERAVVAGRTIGQLLFVDNFMTAIAGAYSPLALTEHLWTVAFEEQVYLVIPLLFVGVVALRRHPWRLAIVAGLLVASQPLLRWAVIQFDDRVLTIWVIPFFHADAILAGLLLAAGAGAALRRTVPGDVLALAGAGILTAVVLALPPAADQLSPDWMVSAFSLIAFSFLLIVGGCLDERSWIAWLLSRQPLVFLGRISYGLYVWHLAGHEWGRDLDWRWTGVERAPLETMTGWAQVVAAALLVTIGVSVVSYYALERPFLRVKRRFTVVPNRED